MSLQRLFLFSIIVVLLAGPQGLAQTPVHFTFTTNTGNNATVGITTSANPNINGTPLASGDEIGAFTPAGLCVGAVVWTGTNTALPVWGDNDMTPAIDGIAVGEQISYRVWDQSANTEYSTVNVTYSQGNGTYAVNGIYVLSSLSAVGAPSAPTLSSPSNGATGVSITPTLSWNASTGATSYQLQVSTSSSFTTTVVNQSGITATSYAVSGLTNNTVYYWRVNATNASGTSPYSDTWSFTTIGAASPPTPTLSSPSNGATGVSITPTLSWNASTGATSYQLQVSTSSSFTTTVVNASGITATSYAASGLSNSTVYYWRVNATNAGGTSAYSVTWTFTTTTTAGPPGPPTLVSPANGATGVSASPTMSWNASSGATSYQLQVSSNSTFTTTAVNQAGITGTSYAVSDLANNTTYYWRVNATNASGTSGYSDVWSFTTTEIPQAPLMAPVLSSPENGATGVPVNPTLTWNASSGAIAYQLQVSADAGFSTIIVNQGKTTSTSYTLSGLNNNTTYYWRVNTTYGGGTSPYSARWSFTTVISPPAAPRLLAPFDCAIGILRNPTLVWEQSTSASSYRVQISEESRFSRIFLDQIGIPSTSYTVTGLASYSTYYWRVSASNEGGSSQWSTVQSFTTSNLSGVDGWSGSPREIRLLQNYPNPFNNSTVIPFELSRAAYVSIEIYSVSGQRVTSLEQGIKQAGFHRVFWQPLTSSGVYYYELAIDGTRLSAKKMIYLR